MAAYLVEKNGQRLLRKSSFERKFDDIKEEKGVEFDTDLTADDLKEVVAIYKEEYKKHAGVEFPQDPKVQLSCNYL